MPPYKVSHVSSMDALADSSRIDLSATTALYALSWAGTQTEDRISIIDYN